MNRILSLAVFGTVLAAGAVACSPVRTVTPPAPVGATPPVTVPAQGLPSASTSQPPGLAPSAVAPPPSLGPVSLQVISPQDGDVVNAPQIDVRGTASPGAVVTVNDDIILVGADGAFQSVVALDEGPNLIEVIASNDSGSESTLDLTVTYEP